MVASSFGQSKFFIGSCTNCVSIFVSTHPGSPPNCDHCKTPVNWNSDRFKLKAGEYICLGPMKPDHKPYIEKYDKIEDTDEPISSDSDGEDSQRGSSATPDAGPPDANAGG